MDCEDKATALRRIGRNIKKHGSHIYIVEQGLVPRFAYTIGLRDHRVPELILAGAIYYDADEVLEILNSVGRQLRGGVATYDDTLKVAELGTFTLRNVDSSWSSMLMLGAFDYYKTTDVNALQVVPRGGYWTIDVPVMSAPFAPETAGGGVGFEMPGRSRFPRRPAQLRISMHCVVTGSRRLRAGRMRTGKCLRAREQTSGAKTFASYR